MNFDNIMARRLPVTALFILLLILFLSSCATRYPLGIPEAEWQAMSQEQRLAAREKQAELKQAEAERRAEEERARAEEAARQQAELNEKRRQAAYGERVQCVLDPVEARIFGSWRQAEPLALDLVVGLELEVPLRERSGSTVRRRSTAYASFDGQTVAVCREPLAAMTTTGRDHCLRLLGTFEDYRRGIAQQLEAPDFLRGRLRCNLVPAAGMPPRLIIER